MKGVSARAYSTNYFQRLTLESWHINLQQIKLLLTDVNPGGGGWDSHMKQTGMHVVSLRRVNFWILVSLKVFRAKRQYLKYACIGYDDHVFISLKPAHCVSYLCVFKRSPIGVKICLSHAQIGLL